MAQINGALTLSAVGSTAPMPTRAARGAKLKPNAAKARKATTVQLGDGIMASWQGDSLMLVIPCDNRTLARAPATTSGRAKLIATTRGWQSLERPSDGKRISLQLGVVAKT